MLILPTILALPLMLGLSNGEAAEVRSLLASKCFACHGPDAETREAGLRLDTLDGQRSRSRSGSIIVPGDPEASLLLKRVQHEDPDRRMPPEGVPLTPDEIELLTSWIESGADWPTHWAWEPVKEIEVPEIKDTEWPRDDLDHFILAGLEAANLQPADDTSPSNWLRRVHFDLIGLPPDESVQDDFMDSFREDPDQAREMIVDELLASDHFGEHWGRHWLDLVRYAETCGHEFDYPIPHAWRYRDWVIRAFNADVPYDRFLVEHVAGDLVADPRIDPATSLNDSLPGTGFWFMAQGTHAPVDVRQDEADRIANQIGVFGKAFSGMTIDCARCHDHKFDPIPTQDYYALSGYLQSSRRRNAYLDPGGEIEERLRQLAEQKQILTAPLHSATAPMDHSIENDVMLVESFESDIDDWFPDGQAFDETIPAGHAYLQDDRILQASSGLIHSGMRSSRAQGTIRSPSFKINGDYLHHRVKGRASRIRVIIDGFIMNEYNPLLFEDCLKNVDNEEWHHIAQKVGKYQGHTAWIEYSDDGDGWIAIDEIRFSDDAGEPVWTGPLEELEPAHDQEQLAAYLQTLNEMESSIASPIRVLAIMDGTPEDEYVFIRGDHKQVGPRTTRSAPSIWDMPTPASPDSSGRLELAESLASTDNPLTSRVMANRIWHHLMGKGIVTTVDDFGAMGQPPTHPELLDHLATRFQSDWSMKNMIRDVVLSRTYGMSSQPDAGSASADPANELWHHRPTRRLNAEAVRDAILTTAGTLNTETGGPPVAVHLTGFMTGRGRPGASGPLDGNGRRTIYQEVRRNFLSPLLLAFDFPLPSETAGKRSLSNVPAQSLILMNDPFVHDQCHKWARTLQEEHDDPEDRVTAMYRMALARYPSEQEQELALNFIKEQSQAHRQLDHEEPELAAWADLGHAIINVKEFIYIP